jgi:hypothetical protein
LENLKRRDHSEDFGIDGEYITKMDLREVGWKGVDWIYLAQNRPVAGSCENCNEISCSINDRAFFD